MEKKISQISQIIQITQTTQTTQTTQITQRFNSTIHNTVNLINQNEQNSARVITDSMTFRELLDIIGPLEKEKKTPTPRKLQEEAVKPLVQSVNCTVYQNGYAVYDNASGRTVLWLPDCVAFTYYFIQYEDNERIDDIKETDTLPDGFLESQPWMIALTLMGDHRIESNLMNRTGSRKGTKDYRCDDHGDKDGQKEKATGDSYRDRFKWKDRPYGENPETAYIRKEELQEALGCLTEKQREAFVLYYKYGYTQQEIGDELGIDRTSVDDRLDGAIKKYKKYFK